MNEKEHVGAPILMLDIHNTKGGTMALIIKPEDLLTTKNKHSIIIGRERESDVIVQPPSDQISRKHCSITYDSEKGWLLKDEGSLSGTWAHPKTYNQYRHSI